MLDILPAMIVLVILGGVIGMTKHFGKNLKPESSRKIIHITMGCVALSFPFVFQYRQSVLILGIVAFIMLLVIRRNKKLREGIGSGLLGVERKTYGEIYFVISIVIVFLLHESLYEYLIPISILTFADSVAALVGTSYGRINLSGLREDRKSGEGSIMFFVVAFICALIPLQLMSEVGRAEVLVISFLIGILAAMIETVSASGNDNLFLPLLTYSFIRFNTSQSLDLLLIKIGVMFLFLGITVVVYKLTNISRLSIAYSLLAGYVFLIQGGAIWMVPPIMLFLTFGILPMMKKEEKEMVQNYKVIECNGMIGFICLWLSVFLPQYRGILYLAFSLSFACHLAINTYSRLINFTESSREKAILWGFVKASLFISIPTVIIAQMHWLTALLYFVCVAISLPPAVALNLKYNYKMVGDTTFRANKTLVGAVVAIFIVVFAVYQPLINLVGALF